MDSSVSPPCCVSLWHTYFGTLWLGTNTLRDVISSGKCNPFIPMQLPSLSMIVFLFWSLLCLSSTVFFCLVLVWYMNLGIWQRDWEPPRNWTSEASGETIYHRLGPKPNVLGLEPSKTLLGTWIHVAGTWTHPNPLLGLETPWLRLKSCQNPWFSNWDHTPGFRTQRSSGSWCLMA